MAKKNITIKLLKAEFISPSIKKQTKKLSDLLIESFESGFFNTAEKRLFELKDIYNNYLLIPTYSLHDKNDIFGSLVELSDLKNPLLSMKSLKEKTIDIESLYKEIEEEDKDSQVIKNICFFYIGGNNIVLQSNKHLTSKDFNLYLNWILKKIISTDISVILRTPINDQKYILKQIKEIMISDADLVLQSKILKSKNGKGTSVSDLNITNRGLINTIISLIKEEGELPEYIPDELVKVSLRLTVDQRKWQKHKDEDKVRQALEVNCRNIPEDIVIKLQDGSTVTATELQYKRTISIDHTLSGVPDSTQLLDNMYAFFKEVCK